MPDAILRKGTKAYIVDRVFGLVACVVEDIVKHPHIVVIQARVTTIKPPYVRNKIYCYPDMGKDSYVVPRGAIVKQAGAIKINPFTVEKPNEHQ